MGNDLRALAKDKDGTHINIENHEFIDDLELFDLSKEEAEIYLLLLKNKVMIAGDINKHLIDTSRTHVYNFLTRLEKSGWVHVNRATKPQTYNPMPPAEVLAKKVVEKRKLLSEQLEDLNQLEEKVLPDLLTKLNAIHHDNSVINIPIQFKPMIYDYFKDNPSVRIEYTHSPVNINPWLNLFFLSCTFHGFFISWHKKPISDEYSLHLYEFESPLTKTHLELANKVMELQANDMTTLLTEREGITEIKPLGKEMVKVDGFSLTQETIAYRKSELNCQALIIHPWKLNSNTIAFFYSNKKENGMKFLEWIIKKVR
jgi:predicted transcriptional regulator